MNNIVRRLLAELGFESKQHFDVHMEKYELKIYPMVLKENNSQVFLVSQIKCITLLENSILDDMPKIFQYYSKNIAYIPESAKNTSLLLCIEVDKWTERLMQEQVAIEDDPYFFKKYILSFKNEDKDQYEVIKNSKNVESEINFIQNYILDEKLFEEFRCNPKNKSIYRLISDLVIKLPMFPLDFKKANSVKTVIKYYEENEKSDNKILLDTILDIIEELDDDGFVDGAIDLVRIWNEGGATI